MNTAANVQSATDAIPGIFNEPHRSKQRWNFRRNWPLHALLLPGALLLLIFNYAPMLGLVMAFQDYKPWTGFAGSEWVGLQHFRTMFEFDEVKQVIWNTLWIASFKIIFHLLVPLFFALMLNEVRGMLFKRSIQTLVYLPHFLSWVILGGILIDILSPSGGLVNQVIVFFGGEPVFFLGNGTWFRITLIATDVWKDYGFGAIVFLAAIAGINPELYEAALMDGANRWKQTLSVTLPSVLPIVIVVGTLSLGNILNAGFDQIFNLYNALVISKGDIIDTYVYRAALLQGNFGFGAAVGVFKSVVSLVLIAIAYRMAYKFANYRIF
ncbi:ABC transporter permease [Paenibacillus gansuensis]|uniref:ABC transporter permease n=1 Tax=Paenibacillus gansuensis TaxID=306542 RepID=A0ABW5PAX9_9BACL